jgi:hypothetical protein
MSLFDQTAKPRFFEKHHLKDGELWVMIGRKSITELETVLAKYSITLN